MIIRVLFSQWTRMRPRAFHARSLVLASVGATAFAIATRPITALDGPDIVQDSPMKTDTATGIEFPELLKIPSRVSTLTLTLLGVGVRTVSFLGIKVYSVGFYADLSNPNLNIPKSASFEEKLEYLLDNTTCAVRLIPTRTTSYTHLRDGFVRAIHGRIKLGQEKGQISKEQELSLMAPLNALKSMFPNAPLKKHASLDVILNPPVKNRERILVFRDIGRIENTWTAKQFFLAYFEGWGISPPMKATVQDSLLGYGI